MKNTYDTVWRENRTGYWKFVFDEEFLAGAVFVGNLDRAGFYTNLIKNRISISKIKNKIRTRTAGYADLLR